MVVCVHIPRFELRVATGGSQELLGRALAIAPSGGGAMAIGEVSPSAQAQGVRAGMALGEALARCPALELIPGDPIRVARAWDQAARALEGIGAQLELARPGLAYFDADGLQGIHGGRRWGDRRRREGAAPAPTDRGGADAVRCARGRRCRRARVARKVIGEREARRYLAGRSVSSCATGPRRSRSSRRWNGSACRRSAESSSSAPRRSATASARPARSRGGWRSATTRRYKRGASRIVWRSRWSSARRTPGCCCERTLDVLVDRLLARPERRGRTIRVLVLSARLVERGTWLRGGRDA